MTELNAVPWDIPARENPIESSVEVEAPAETEKPKGVSLKKTPKKTTKSKAKAKATYNVRTKKSVAVKTETVVGPDYKDQDGNVIELDVDEAYVKKLIQETLDITVPEGVAGKDILPQYACYTRLYDIFNAVFFGNQLEPVMLIFQETRHAHGYYRFVEDPKGGIWQDGKRKLSEIAINPLMHFTLFAEGEGERAVSTLLHEMCHHWEFKNATESDIKDPKTGKLKLPKSNYHSKTFANKMESVGLYTTNDGTREGQRSGRNVSHLVMNKKNGFSHNGPFSRVFKMLPKELLWPWMGPKGVRGKEKLKPAPASKVSRSKNKVKYECPMIHTVNDKGVRSCDVTIWSKPDREGQLACMNHGDPVNLVAINNPE